MVDDTEVVVDRDGIYFPDPRTPVCDILIEGRRVLSMLPADQRQVRNGKEMVPWPEPLRVYLRGVAHVTVREHGSGVTRYDGEVRLDDSAGRTEVVGANGRPLTVSKWGGLSQTFDDSDDVGAQIEMTAALLHDLNDLGVPAYAAYGTLLGAVRSGRVIGYDTDADVSYLSKYSHPADIARESFELQRQLLKRGWRIERGRLGKLTVAQLHKVDIFVSYFVGDQYFLDQWVEGPLRRDQILPLSTVTLEGYDLPAPADPEALLALNYGPNWRTPDPSFGYDNASAHLERIRGWFGGHGSHEMDWNRYWTRRAETEGRRASPFARWVAERIDPDALLVDVGCGYGADAIALSELGIDAVGYDFSARALTRARRAAAQMSPRPRFRRLTLADTRVAVAEGARLASMPRAKTVVARLVLDALPADGYVNFWLLLRLLTVRGGTAYLEFRAKRGSPLPGSPPHLWRRLVDIEDVRWRLITLGGVITEERVAEPNESDGVLTPMRRLAVRFSST